MIASRGPLSTAWTDFELTNQIASFNLAIRGSIFIRSHARILRKFWQRYKGSEEATFERDWRGEHVSATEAYSDIGSCSTHRLGKNTKLLNLKKNYIKVKPHLVRHLSVIVYCKLQKICCTLQSRAATCNVFPTCNGFQKSLQSHKKYYRTLQLISPGTILSATCVAMALRDKLWLPQDPFPKKLYCVTPAFSVQSLQAQKCCEISCKKKLHRVTLAQMTKRRQISWF